MSGGGSQSSTSNTTVPPQFLDAYQNTVNRAQKVAGQGYQGYGGQLVAGFSPQQIAAQNEVTSIQGAYAPELQNAQNSINASTTPLWSNTMQSGVNPSSGIAGYQPDLSASKLQQYENPFQSQVINATEAQIGNTDAQQQTQLAGNAASAGAFGGDRMGVAQGILGGQQAIANNSTLAGLNTQNYNQAVQTDLASNQMANQEFNTQQQAQLGANEANSWLNSQAGYAEANLAQEGNSLALSDASAMAQSGLTQQQQTQAGLNTQYQQWQAQQAFPYQQTGWLANITEGIGSNVGGTSTTTSSSSNRGGRIQRAGGGIIPVSPYDTTPYSYSGQGQGQMPISILGDVPDLASPYIPGASSGGGGGGGIGKGPPPPPGTVQGPLNGSPVAGAAQDISTINGAVSLYNNTGAGNWFSGGTQNLASTAIPQAAPTTTYAPLANAPTLTGLDGTTLSQAAPTTAYSGIANAPIVSDIAASTIPAATPTVTTAGLAAAPTVTVDATGAGAGYLGGIAGTGSTAASTAAGAGSALAADAGTSAAVGAGANAAAGAGSAIAADAAAAGTASAAGSAVTGAATAAAADTAATAAGTAAADAGAGASADWLLTLLAFLKDGGRVSGEPQKRAHGGIVVPFPQREHRAKGGITGNSGEMPYSMPPPVPLQATGTGGFGSPNAYPMGPGASPMGYGGPSMSMPGMSMPSMGSIGASGNTMPYGGSTMMRRGGGIFPHFDQGGTTPSAANDDFSGAAGTPDATDTAAWNAPAQPSAESTYTPEKPNLWMPAVAGIAGAVLGRHTNNARNLAEGVMAGLGTYQKEDQQYQAGQEKSVSLAQEAKRLADDAQWHKDQIGIENLRATNEATYQTGELQNSRDRNANEAKYQTGMLANDSAKTSIEGQRVGIEGAAEQSLADWRKTQGSATTPIGTNPATGGLLFASKFGGGMMDENGQPYTGSVGAMPNVGARVAAQTRGQDLTHGDRAAALNQREQQFSDTTARQYGDSARKAADAIYLGSKDPLSGQPKMTYQQAVDAANQSMPQLFRGPGTSSAQPQRQAAPTQQQPQQQAAPAIPAGLPQTAKQAPDGNWYVPNPNGGWLKATQAGN